MRCLHVCDEINSRDSTPQVSVSLNFTKGCGKHPAHAVDVDVCCVEVVSLGAAEAGRVERLARRNIEVQWQGQCEPSDFVYGPLTRNQMAE
jgi:hypothetical protein